MLELAEFKGLMCLSYENHGRQRAQESISVRDMDLGVFNLTSGRGYRRNHLEGEHSRE